MAVAPDVEQIRNSFAQNLMKQRNEAMRGVQDIYAQRGVTGGGEEAKALGDTGYNFGLGMGQGEAALQQYMGNLGQQQYEFGQNFGEQQRQFNQGQSNWGQQFGEQQRQFDTGQGNWQSQFGENQRQFNVGSFGNADGTGTTLAGQQLAYQTDFDKQKELARLGGPKEAKGGFSFIVSVSF